MKKLWFFVLLCVASALLSCQRSTKGSATAKPDSGNFAQNTYRNDFFGFSYILPKEWHKSRVSPSPLPPGAYYLFIGDRYTDHPLLTRVMIVADPESSNRAGLSGKEYVSAFVRAEVNQSHAEITRQPSPISSGGNDFYRADYKFVSNGTTFYSSLSSIERKGYWLNWTFVAPSQQDLDDALITIQQISFDDPSPQPR